MLLEKPTTRRKFLLGSLPIGRGQNKLPLLSAKKDRFIVGKVRCCHFRSLGFPFLASESRRAMLLEKPTTRRKFLLGSLLALPLSDLVGGDQPIGRGQNKLPLLSAKKDRFIVGKVRCCHFRSQE
jgi:hypothetical protein